MTTNQDILTSIYDAALSDKNWGRALDTCKQAVGAELALLYQFSIAETVSFALEETSSNVVQFAPLLAEYNQLVADGRGSNYDQEGLGFVHTTPPFAVTLDDNIWSLDQTYLDRPEVQIGLRTGCLRRSFVNLSSDPITMSGLVFMYGRQFDAAIPNGIGQSGPLIAPHVSKAAEIFRLTNGLRQRYQAVLSVLDRISTGILVVLATADVVVKNSSARHLIEDGSGIFVSNTGQIAAVDDTANAALKQGIAQVSATAEGDSDKPGVVIQCPRRGTEVPLIAVITPLRDAEMEIEKGLVGALITLIDPLRPIEVQSDLVATAYGLTNAEARVAALVLQGLSNAEISERIEVSPETIKSQISAILAKTGCKSRVAFIWRVFQLSPPIQ